jgi:hypothetical protein
MKRINKTSDTISPYTYLIKFKVDDKILMYYGVRYGNVRLNLKPSEDLFIKYFTSSKDVNLLLSKEVLPFEIIIHKTFNTINDACQFEVDFLSRIDAKHNDMFLNHTNSFKNDLTYSNKNRILSDETKHKISLASSEWQSSLEYRESRRLQSIERWKDPVFKQYMKERNQAFLDSDKGKSFIKDHLNQIWVGREHSNETKLKMSESAKKALENVDMKTRALNRKRYSCPICGKSNLDGGNFNQHVKIQHEWTKEQSQSFKKSNTPQ